MLLSLRYAMSALTPDWCDTSKDPRRVSAIARTTIRGWAAPLCFLNSPLEPPLQRCRALAQANTWDQSLQHLPSAEMPDTCILRSLPHGGRRSGTVPASTLRPETCGKIPSLAIYIPMTSRAHSQTTIRAALPPRGTAELSRMD